MYLTALRVLIDRPYAEYRIMPSAICPKCSGGAKSTGFE